MFWLWESGKEKLARAHLGAESCVRIQSQTCMAVQCDSMLGSIRRLWQFDLLGMRCDSLLITQLAGVCQSADNAERRTRTFFWVEPVSAKVRAVGRQSGGHDCCSVLVMDDGVEFIYVSEVEIWTCVGYVCCVVLISTRSGRDLDVW